jgi:hypothetical protein
VTAGPRARTDVRVLRGLRGVSAKLLFAMVALSIVLMHHVVAAHEHVAPANVETAAQATHVVDTTSPSDPLALGLVERAGEEPASAGPAAMLHVHHQGGDHGASMLLHACLAVLAALAAVLVLLVLVLWRPWSFAGLLMRGAVPEVPVRGPPVPRRLAQLQVLRL